MRIVHFSLTPLAGMPVRLAAALRRHGGLDARLVDATRFGLFGQDVVFDETPDLAVALAEAADVICLHNYLGLASTAFAPIDFAALARRGAAVLRQFHSTPELVAGTMGIPTAALLADPLPSLVIAQYPERLYPRAMVVPNFVPEDEDAYRPAAGPPDVDVFFSHTKTVGAFEDRWNTKAAPEVTALLADLHRRQGVTADIATGVPLAEALGRKRRARLVVDDLVSGSYHLTGLEGLSMAKPVLSYLDGRCLELLAAFAGTAKCPFVNVRLEDAGPALLALHADPLAATDIGALGREWLVEHWSAASRVAYYVDAYERLLRDPALVSRQPEFSLDGPGRRFFAVALPEAMHEARKTAALRAALLPPPYASGRNFFPWRISRKSHFAAFTPPPELAFRDAGLADLKYYQHLLAWHVLSASLPEGARVLEIGGGDSPLGRVLAKRFDYTNLDPLAGAGNGPTGPAAAPPGRLVRAALGDFSPQLADRSFDAVVSVSALEHVPEDPAVWRGLADDLSRLGRPGSFHLHLFDVVARPDGPWTSGFLPYLLSLLGRRDELTPFAGLEGDPDWHFLGKAAYDRNWRPVTGQPFDAFGRAFSWNLFFTAEELPPPCEDAAHATVTLLGADAAASLALPIILVRKKLPAIRLVTPSLDQAAFLPAALDSVLSQGYPALEYVVHDGGSTDGSAAIVRRASRHLHSWRSGPDGGHYPAVAAGFAGTGAPILGWLNADDLLHPLALMKVADTFLADPGSQWITGRPTAFDASGRVTWVRPDLPDWSPDVFYKGDFRAFIQQESTFFRRELWEAAGAGFCNDFRLAGDFDLWLRFFKLARLRTVDRLLGGYRRHGSNRAVLGRDRYLAEVRASLDRHQPFFDARKKHP
ncbi:glycosyl transferase family 2 [Solidesulfovibrio carbinoliphilus subsp. oakridgensis]|uniref:Glycosyl transferase family 2 n=1 Tax=Solidesulfovibrio carbinoliphilus subsp. oakridgensis TaxID=694327 RepID=G7Q7S8_9BACT|nr:glycosyltransferase [Solidesulfovibrio carbinoliphilus]EHJ47387.1 glycosyl transferase family 2 [Solidesulfovibrio carbinoliphilus subsp. oakridgensis]